MSALKDVPSGKGPDRFKSSAIEANDKEETHEKETEEVSERIYSWHAMSHRCFRVSQCMSIILDCSEILMLTLVPYFHACLLVSIYPILIGRFSKVSCSIERVFCQLEFG